MHDRILGGRYWLVEPHAMGGMASVWRAIDGRTTDTVAIKRLHPHLVADDAARSRLEREARTLASIRHPNVVAVRDLIIDGVDPALVLDFVEGRSLADRLADGAPIATAEALAIAAGIADGLGSVHAAGIVHRDVKPGNVLLADDGTVRLSDFGIAIGLADDAALTAADGVVGTLRYLAPERLAGAPATPATDVWGVGAILFELLAGRPAFPGGTVAERMDATVDDLERPAGIDDATWSVVTTALATDPGERQADGAALAAAIRALPTFPAGEQIDSAVLDAPTEIIPIAAAAAVAPAAPVASLATAATPASSVAAPAAAAAAVAPAAARSDDAARTRRPWAVGALLAALIAVAAVGMAAGEPGGAPAAAAPTAEPTPAEVTPALEEATPADDAASEGHGKGKAKGHDKERDEDKEPED